jgi:hypothetical protein
VTKTIFVLLFFVVSAFAAEPWPGVAYDRVVGYTFVNEHPKDDVLTLLRGAKLNAAQLKEFKTAEMALSAAQSTRLITAASTSQVRTPGAACYVPHNIFVFYDRAGNPVAAIELCFSCNHVHAIPAREVDWTADWAALAKLSWELGLGFGSSKESLDQYLDGLKDKFD